MQGILEERDVGGGGDAGEEGKQGNLEEGVAEGGENAGE